MYKKAAQLQPPLRFNTASVEDLFRLSLPVLNETAKALHKKVKESEEEDFLGESNKEAELNKLRFDIVVDVINTRKAERDEALNAAARKQEKQEILAELEARRQGRIKNLPEEDLRKRLAELG